MRELTRRLLNLPREQRQRIARLLSDSLVAEEREDDGSRFSVLYKAATEVCGVGILTQARDFDLVMGRRMIAYQMKKEGYSYVSIGRHLVRHHSSVIHMVAMMEDAIEYQFPVEMGYWKRFQNYLEEYDIHKRTDGNS
jgi:chromosomal replication initiation ATPase DnaA